MTRLKQILVGLMLLGIPFATDAGSKIRFIAGEVAAADRFGSEGPVLLGIGCLAIVVIYFLLIWNERRHRQIAGELDAIAEQVQSREAQNDA